MPDASHNLLMVLQEWRRWTVAESEAMRAENWTAVQQCQEMKRLLQERFDQQAGTFMNEDADRLVGALASELIDMEQANQSWIAQQLRAVAEERRQLEASGRNLHRLRSSYGQPANAFWNSYG